MARRYFIFDNQDGSFGMSSNEDGGVTLKELRETASEWLDSDGVEDCKAPVKNKWSLDRLANFGI